MANKPFYISGVCLKKDCRRRADAGVLCRKCMEAGHRRATQAIREKAKEPQVLILKDGTILTEKDRWPKPG